MEICVELNNINIGLKKIIPMLLVILVLFGCDGTSMMSGKFSSMDSCLNSIKQSTGSSLKVVTNKLGDISGTLSNGQNFGCQTKSSGTDGVYVEGWYTYKER